MSAPADAGTTPYRRILILVVALILYGSLYPWDFHLRRYGASPLWILLHRWDFHINRYLIWDVAVNIVLYLPLGIFGFLSMSPRASRILRIALPLTMALVLSASVEMLQLFDDSRMCSLSDVASNMTGTALGMAAGALYRGRLQRLLARHGPATLLRPSGAVLLLACWFGYQVFPLFPTWGRTNLYRRIAAVGPLTAISPVETLIVFAEWLAVACLLESLFRRQARVLLVLMLMVIPGKLIIAGRSLTWADLVGPAAALAAWVWLPRPRLRRSVPWLLTAALILAELAPFHRDAPQAFVWVPFRGLFRSDWQDGFVVLFRKSFWYGAVLWLWRGSGYRLALTAPIAAVALFVLERAQVYLPGRTPEITDVVLALMMGLLLWLLRDV